MTYFEDLKTQLYDVADSIDDSITRRFVYAVLNVAPQSFWYDPASRSHHMKDERGPCGNLLHSIRVAKASAVIADACGYDRDKRDEVIAAAILHDVCRYGANDEHRYGHSTPEHPRLVWELVKKHNLTMFEPARHVCTIIQNHMGRWGEGLPDGPDLALSDTLHIADVIVARAAEVL